MFRILDNALGSIKNYYKKNSTFFALKQNDNETKVGLNGLSAGEMNSEPPHYRLGVDGFTNLSSTFS